MVDSYSDPSVLLHVSQLPEGIRFQIKTSSNKQRLIGAGAIPVKSPSKRKLYLSFKSHLRILQRLADDPSSLHFISNLE